MNATNGDHRDKTITSRSRLSSLTPEQLVQINLCCDAYERSWRENGPNPLDDYLENVLSDQRMAALRSDLVQELVLVDIELRQRSGLQTSAEYYLKACPTLNCDWLHEQLAQSTAHAQKADPGQLRNGQRIGDYVILEPLGAGGMGTVYRAEHVLMKRRVALKIVQREHQANLLLQRRFEREVRTLAKLSHPNVVTAFDARQDSGWLYLITELIEGVDLGKLVRKKGPLSPIKAAHYAWQAANGLQYAHSKGIVHRDIKPENLLLDQNQKIKVLDLGLARLSSPEMDQTEKAGLTQSSQVLGTAGYISPEQARTATAADHRSDIYSLGCTLFFLLTGRPPYVGDSLVATIVAHMSDPVPTVASLSAGQTIPAQLDVLIQSMMAKDPNDRPASMNVVVSELTKIIKQLQTKSQSSTKLTETHRDVLLPNVLSKLWPFRRMLGRRILLLGMLIVTPAVALTTYLAFSSLNSESPNLGPNFSTPAGLRFNGIDHYVEVSDFNEAITGHVAIEAIVRPNFTGSTANIVTWAGRQSFVLFRSAKHEWGAAYFDGVAPRLIVASQSSRPGTTQMVAAMWNGTQLSLHVDGKPIESYPIEYEMIRAPQRLFIGGIPEGIIPSHQGTRFLDGDIAVVRVSRSAKPLRLSTDPAELVIQPETLALFDFRKPTYANAVDQTNRWRFRLRGTLPKFP